MVGGPEATLTSRDRASSPAPLEGAGGSHDGEVLALEDIGVRFGGISALANVSLSVPEGVVLGLIGPNGAGKTTLFDVISGVRAPNHGRVWFRGSDATRSSAIARSRRGLRRTFQRVQTFGWLTVEDNVLAALEWRGGGGGMLADVVRFPTRRSRERSRRERHRAVREVEDARRRVREHEPRRHDPVDRAGDEAGEREVPELLHAPGSSGSSVSPR
jgi:ABC-type branched-subunit amino acid transport system ATPase component